MYQLTLKHHFDAAHRLLPNDNLFSKKCSNLHGHRWEVIIKLKSKKLINGMVVDFGKIKDVIDYFDHKTLLEAHADNFVLCEIIKNTCGEDSVIFLRKSPTAENLSEILYYKVQRCISPGIKIQVEVKESPDSSIVYAP